jgi:hypothetical protein
MPVIPALGRLREESSRENGLRSKILFQNTNKKCDLEDKI